MLCLSAPTFAEPQMWVELERGNYNSITIKSISDKIFGSNYGMLSVNNHNSEITLIYPKEQCSKSSNCDIIIFYWGPTTASYTIKKSNDISKISLPIFEPKGCLVEDNMECILKDTKR